MRLLDAAKNFVGRITSALSLTQERGWEGTTFLGARATTGRGVTPQAARQLSAYFACVRVIAEDIAKLPVAVIRELDRGHERLPDHAVARLIKGGPNPGISRFTFFELVTGWAASWGNGFAEIQRDRIGNPIALWPIHPSRMKIIRRGDGEIAFLVKSATMDDTEIASENMIHIRNLGDSDLLGDSVAHVMAQALDLALSQQEYAANFFGNSASVSGVLKHPGKLDEQASQRLRKSWAEIYGGPANAGKVAVLEEGMDFGPVSMPLKDAQFLQSRMFSIEETARAFRVPPHKIQHLTRATFNNIEQQNIEYAVDTLGSWVARWEAELDRKLTPEDDISVRFSLQALLRGDNASRAKFYKDMVGIGAMTPNEVRQLEDINPYDEGDRFFMPVNIAPVATADGTPVPPGGGPIRESSGDLPLDAVVPSIADAAARTARKEAKAAERALKKISAEARRDAMVKFAQPHGQHVAENMRPAVEMALGPDAVNGELDVLGGELTRDLVSNVCESPTATRQDIASGTFEKQRAQAIAARFYDLISARKRDILIAKLEADNGD